LEQIKNFKQRGKGLEERYEAVQDAFRFKREFKHAIEDRYIVLIDDVVTSCATVSECSKVLINNGALKVDVLTCGRNRLE